MPEEVEKTYPAVELDELSKEMLVSVIENMALKFSDEVDAAPFELISDSYQAVKDDASKFQIDVDRGHNGYTGQYKTLEEGLMGLDAYLRSFPNQQVIVKITPINSNI